MGVVDRRKDHCGSNGILFISTHRKRRVKAAVKGVSWVVLEKGLRPGVYAGFLFVL